MFRHHFFSMLLVLVVPIGSAQCQTRSELGVDAGMMAWTMNRDDHSSGEMELVDPPGLGFSASIGYRETPARKTGLDIGFVYSRMEFDMHAYEGGLGSGKDTYEHVRADVFHLLFGLNTRLSENSRFHLRSSLLIGGALTTASGYSIGWAQASPPDTIGHHQVWWFEDREVEGFGGGLRLQLGLAYSIPIGQSDVISCEVYGNLGPGRNQFQEAGLRIGYAFGFNCGTVGEFFRKDRERRFGKKPSDP